MKLDYSILSKLPTAVLCIVVVISSVQGKPVGGYPNSLQSLGYGAPNHGGDSGYGNVRTLINFWRIINFTTKIISSYFYFFTCRSQPTTILSTRYMAGVTFLDTRSPDATRKQMESTTSFFRTDVDKL